MRFPIIRVRDKASDGHIHIVGEDVHDSLYINEQGQISYYNLQNGDGTRSGDYQFCGVSNALSFASLIEFVDIEDLEKMNAKAVQEEKRAKEARMKMFDAVWNAAADDEELEQ